MTTGSELCALSMFADLSDAQAEWLLQRSRLESFPAGAVVHQGDTASGAFFVLLEGAWLNERRVRGTLEPLRVARDTPGTWFGGLDFVDAVAPMRAIAERDSRFLAIPTSVMLEAIRQDFPVSRHLMSGVRAGMSWFLEHLEKHRS